ncbi:hypothetical protein OEA41_009785 [Lepraria neglecta]|uniref:Protein kinase domain-containing protein n=1 Tax=Lepraria neglecta TaxID=209136 RepID=A0AAE0DEZ3_9LECA|nr:hypothetical protein OEA41_009785 [Lepraria neglecta]
MEEGRYKFMFAHPEGTSPNDPVSLRDIVRGEDPSCKRLALSARFQVAQVITMALAAFHAGRWVHKGLRSESIKFFRKDGVVQYDSPYLADFEYSRPESDKTLFTYDDDIEKNVYRHPDRQGPPSVQFTKIHDIYALGVVLLEIGMWRTASTIYHEYCKVVKQRGGGGGIVDPKICREIFMDKAEGNLPHYMGRAYADAVSACLAGRFDNGISDGAFAMEFHHQVRLQSKRDRMPPPTPLLIPRDIPTPLPDDLRQDIRAALVRERAIKNILKALKTECGKAGWEDALKARVNQLLRSGEFKSRADLVGAIIREAKGLPVAEEEEGEDREGGKVKGKGRGRDVKGEEKLVDIKIPDKAIAEGAKVVRGVLEKVGELEPEAKGFWDT